MGRTKTFPKYALSDALTERSTSWLPGTRKRRSRGTTRRHDPGPHRFEVLVNGQGTSIGEVDVLE